MSGDLALPPNLGRMVETQRFVWNIRRRVGKLRPDGTFDAIWEAVTHNIQTDHGDQVFAKLVAQVSGATAVTGMRLGTGTATPTKTGSGAAIGTYLNNSSIALSDVGQGAGKPGVPVQVGGGGQGYSFLYQADWPAATCPSHLITEAVLTDATIANAAGTAGNTVARATFGPDDNQPAGVDQDYQIQWYKISLG